ncbi:hypothetical protein BX600DRAFT_13900 [Xylariales sp. PMI_506]|nr:hypothetical protein BX600DRAFT_13900 [Xylariales sp. PMI_506]
MANTSMSRLRHIHIPDSAPHFPPFWMVSNVGRYLMGQTVGAVKAKKAAQQLGTGRERRSHDAAIPPPTVLSFTPHPTYFTANKTIVALAREIELPQMTIQFPRMSANLKFVPNFLYGHERGRSSTIEERDDPYDFDYVPAISATLQRNMPPYLGPGRLVLWPVFDLRTQGRRYDRGPKCVKEHSELLAKTTIACLKREFGIAAWADSNYTALHTKLGKIASIWPKFDYGVASCGVSINVSQPSDGLLGDLEGAPTPEVQKMLRDDADRATTIWAELESEVGAPPSADRIVDCSQGWRIRRRLWYTQSNEERARSYAPLGMDNYPLAVSWSHELASQLGISRVDYRSPSRRESRVVGSYEQYRTLPERLKVSTESYLSLTDKWARHAHQTLSVKPPAAIHRADPSELVPSWLLTQWRLYQEIEMSVRGGLLGIHRGED